VAQSLKPASTLAPRSADEQLEAKLRESDPLLFRRDAWQV
jgi:hypothetical protein